MQSNGKLFPRESGAYIAKLAKYISIKDSGVKKLAEEIAKSLEDKTLALERFSQSELHPDEANENGINWIFVVDTLNFCFWSTGKHKWTVTYRSKPYTGYFALCAAINRALDEGYNIASPSYYSQISEKDLSHILRGDEGCPQIPLLTERRKCLHQVGNVLLDKFDGTFTRVLEKAENSAVKLLELIVTEFECFRDEAHFEGKRVAIYKRAQILVGDIWACSVGKGYGNFSDIGMMTMFADYRVPQVLVSFGALEYSNELLEKLNAEKFLENGCREEVEIRGASIEIVERILKEVKKILPHVTSVPSSHPNEILCNSILVDHFLWDYRRAHADELEHIPFHKTLCIYY